jgi:penicillin-insensitive murein endopeptidase
MARRARNDPSLATHCAMRICAWLVPSLLACSSTPVHVAPSNEAKPALAHAAGMTTLAPSANTSVPAASAEAAHDAMGANAANVEPAPVDEATRVMALDGSHSASLGSPSHGSLQGGVRFPDQGPGFVHNPKRPDEARYGTVELVQTIMKAAAVVEREMPGVPLVVNDLGLEPGGPIHQHGSHESGRDADILYYSFDEKGQPLQSVGVPIDPSGKGFDFKDNSIPDDDQPVRLDAARTWRFVQALIEEGGDAVQRIFMVEHVRSMLLKQADRAHAPAAIRDRFADITCQPDTPHDDHMHLRLFCSAEDIAGGCLDKPPIYPWHMLALKALGLTAQLESAQWRREGREGVKERTTTPAQARKRAGPMHAKVRRFLAQREAWLKQPHPGREYCR